MNMKWEPLVRSKSLVEIPVVVATHSANAHERWKDAQKRWSGSGYQDDSAFGRYARLAKQGGFRFPKGGQRAYKFGEFHTGLLLNRAGFKCWTCVQLFDHRNPRKGFWKKNTDEVKTRWSETDCKWPGDIQEALAFLPKTPDIVAWHPDTGWRFCEVKRPGDRNHPDQLKALAVLHLLTGAPVAIVRVVPEGGRIDSTACEAVVTWKGARPRWIRARRTR
jgi:hypothetical protein